MDVAFTSSPRGHSAYQELLATPPEGVTYHERPLDWRASVYPGRLRNALYWKARGARRRAFGLPEAVPVPDWGMPVHSTQNLLRTRQSWVVDFEHPWAFTGFDGDLLVTPRTRERLARLVEPAGALVAWTEAAAGAMATLVPAAASKLRVVRAAAVARPPAQADPDAPLVLFVGRHFRRKGGLEACEAFVRVREEVEPRARMLVISNAPEAVRAKYEPHGITFWQVPVPRERVLTEFARASVFLMPTHFDTFGMVFVEAFAHGIPVVTADTFGIDEIVTDGVDGHVVRGYAHRWFGPDGLPSPGAWRWADVCARQRDEERARIVDDLAAALGPLLADPRRARDMGFKGRDKVLRGALSVQERNARLRAVYREAFGA